MSLNYLNKAVAEGDAEKLIRYVRLHFGDDDEAAGGREIDKAWIDKEKMTLDVSGHYSRPDVFDFAVNRQSRRN